MKISVSARLARSGQILAVAAAATTAACSAQVPAPAQAPRVQLTIQADQVVRTMSPRRLGGTNVALWNDVQHFRDPQLRKWMADLRPGYIRLPGGSWSNCVYWNGHGVRDASGKLDKTRMGPDGYPAVDYSGYAPSFTVNNSLQPTGEGNVDVKTVHDWIQSLPGVEPLPCPNLGLGRAVDAAEWVKWSNQKMGYNARVWELGNELGGSWEPGTRLPNSDKTITPEIFTQNYNAFAKAMREVDPTIKIGACTFTSAMLRDCGRYVDFVGIHAYPGTTAATPQENLAAVGGEIAKQVAHVKADIRKYQPERENEIEISYTEWNLSGGLNASDLFGGLWHSLFLAEMAKSGVHFATQWDIYTHHRGMKSGHGLIFTDGQKYTRKAPYHAMWLWNNYTGDRLLQSTADRQGVVYSLASRDDAAVYVQLINPNQDHEAVVQLQLNGFQAADRGERAMLTSREYYWNSLTSVPSWSQDPRIELLKTGNSFEVTLPPFSLTHVRIPSASTPALTARAQDLQPQPAGGQVELKFVLPEDIYVGDRVEGTVQAFLAGTDAPYPAALPAAALSSTPAGTMDRTEARLAEAAGRFFVTAKEPGTLTVKAAVQGATVEKTLNVKSSVPRPAVYWFFDKPSLSEKEVFSSEYQLTADPNVRPNKDVARIELPKEGAVPNEKQRTLFMVRQLPPREKLDRSNIRGAVFDMMCKGISSEDPNASVMVVMQSPANYWMVLGHVPLKNSDKWETHQVVTENPKHMSAMASTYNLWLVLSSSKPVTGTVYFDRIGLMVR